MSRALLLVLLLAATGETADARVWRLSPANGTDDTATCGDSWDRPCCQLQPVSARGCVGA